MFNCPQRLLTGDIRIVTDAVDDHFGRVTERLRERDAVEIDAVLAAVDRRQVEDEDENEEDDGARDQARDNNDDLEVSVLAAERDERHQGEGEDEAESEAEAVRVVVDHRQEAAQEENDEDDGEFRELKPRTFDYRPTVD